MHAAAPVDAFGTAASAEALLNGIRTWVVLSNNLPLIT
jgi:hypothetical protein